MITRIKLYPMRCLTY